MSDDYAEALKIIEDWEDQASERDNRDPMKGVIYREAAVLRRALASPLSAEAMKRAAVEAFPSAKGFDRVARNRIDALPSTTPAQMLAEAREMPQIKAVRAAFDAVGKHPGIEVSCMGDDAAKTWNALCTALAALEAGDEDLGWNELPRNGEDY